MPAKTLVSLEYRRFGEIWQGLNISQNRLKSVNLSALSRTKRGQKSSHHHLNVTAIRAMIPLNLYRRGHAENHRLRDKKGKVGRLIIIKGPNAVNIKKAAQRTASTLEKRAVKTIGAMVPPLGFWFYWRLLLFLNFSIVTETLNDR